MADDSISIASWRSRYAEKLPEDKTHLARAWKLLETYSHIPPEEIEAHVTAVRNKAYAIFQYPCIGRWRFLDLYLTSAPEYPSIVARLRAGDRLLDVGCCFGQVLRQLAADGAPPENLAGTDLRPEFLDLGYELFRDRGRFAARLVPGDIFDEEAGGPLREELDGRFGVVHAASFFHLFGWDDQVRAGERVVRFLRPDAGAGALVLGRQVGRRDPPPLEAWRASGERRYHHNVESLQRLWDVIGERTGTRWAVSGVLFESDFDDAHRTLIRFVVKRVVE